MSQLENEPQDAPAAEQSALKNLPAKSEIDLQALAERIVHLLKQNARLEKERLGGGRPWSKKVTRG
jgi:hypothetical protein